VLWRGFLLISSSLLNGGDTGGRYLLECSTYRHNSEVVVVDSGPSTDEGRLMKTSGCIMKSLMN
jgi:hypothetical protein